MRLWNFSFHEMNKLQFCPSKQTRELKLLWNYIEKELEFLCTKQAISVLSNKSNHIQEMHKDKLVMSSSFSIS